jgi:NDP-sugar pyrophosphorylase family protein
MTQLLQALVQAGRRLVSFPVLEYWLDIGQPLDYQHAQAYARNERLSQQSPRPSD